MEAPDSHGFCVVSSFDALRPVKIIQTREKPQQTRYDQTD
jgi:precorrin-3B methylase